MIQSDLLRSPADAGPPIVGELESATVGEGLASRHYANVFSAMVLFVARLLTAVIQLRSVDHVWGGAFTGLNVLGNQVLLYVTLLELGLSQAATTLLYEPVLKGNAATISGLIVAVRRDMRLLVGAGAVLVIPALAVYTHLIHSSLSFGTVFSALCLVACSGLVQLMAVHFQVYLNAAERLDRVNYTLAGGYLLKTGIGLPLAVHFHQYLLLPATVAIISLLELTSLRILFGKAFPAFIGVSSREASRTVRGRARFAAIHKIAGIAYYQSDFIILSLTTSLLVVKDYAKYQYISAALLSMVGLLANALTTSVARLQLRNHAENRRKQYGSGQFLMAVIGIVLVLGFFWTAPEIASLAFGGTAAVTRNALILFGVALLLNIVKSVDDVFIAAKGAFQVGYWIPMVEVPIYIGLGLLLTSSIGYLGILVASILTNLIVSIALKGFVLARPVFDSTTAQWFIARTVSLGKAMLVSAPLWLLYPLIEHSRLPKVAVTILADAAAFIYLLLVIRYLLSGRMREGEAV